MLKYIILVYKRRSYIIKFLTYYMLFSWLINESNTIIH